MEGQPKYQELRHRLQEWRAAQGFRSAEAAAQAIGVSTTTFYNWERGVKWPSPVNLHRLLSAGADVGDFLSPPSVEEKLDLILDGLTLLVKDAIERRNQDTEILVERLT